MKIFKKVTILSAIIFFCFLFGQVVLAAGDYELGSFASNAGYNQKLSLNDWITSGINIALSLVGILFFGMALYAGIRWMTAQGNEENVTKAKDTLEAAIIGLAIVFVAYAVSTFVFKALQGVNTNNGIEVTIDTSQDCATKSEGATCGQESDNKICNSDHQCVVYCESKSIGGTGGTCFSGSCTDPTTHQSSEGYCSNKWICCVPNIIKP